MQSEKISIMKSVYITLLTIVGMVLSVNVVAQTTGSINEWGEMVDEYGGILAPPAGDTVKFKRIAGSSIYTNTMNSTKLVSQQRGSTMMVVCNDSVYYWRSPLCMMALACYWMKGTYDKQAQTVSFPQLQPHYYHPNDVVSFLGWCMKYKKNSYKPALDYADAFVFDINGDTLTLRGSQSFTQTSADTAYFMGGVYDNKFTVVGDGGTVLVRQHPVAERDTVVVKAIRLVRRANGGDGHGYTRFSSKNEEYSLIQICLNGSNKTLGTFISAGIDYSECSITSVEGERMEFYDGELTIFEDNEGYKMQGVMIGTDEKAYVIDLVQPAGTFEMDAYVDLDLTVSMDSVEITKNDSMGCFVLFAALWDYYIELDLFADLSATTFPVGDYTVSNTRQPFTALQSIGYIGAEVHPSCVVAVGHSSDGSVWTNNLWMFVSGTISVNADGSILAVGKNSYGRDIRIQFTPPTEQTGLMTPNNDADKLVRKILRQGQLLIQHAGKTYNLLGAPICH